jgi:hypothetical protein
MNLSANLPSGDTRYKFPGRLRSSGIGQSNSTWNGKLICNMPIRFDDRSLRRELRELRLLPQPVGNEAFQFNSRESSGIKDADRIA